MGKMSLIKGFTDDREIHLQADELKELEAVHVGHDDVTDHQVELVPILPLPEHVQCRLGVRHHRYCIATPEFQNNFIVRPKILTMESGK
jgi:hypothetical protein